MKTDFVLLIAFTAAVIPLNVTACGRSNVFLKDNGYRHLLVAIDDKVEEDPRLVDRIKEVLTNASRLLYQMSRRRVYFQDVHILLPRTWSQAAHSLPTWQRADGGDVRVKPWQSVGPGLVEDTPFTLKATSCGFPGQFLHLTPRYLLDDTVAANFGPYDKVFVHEWSHLRYGVFDEYGIGSQFYADDTEVRGIRCPAILTGDTWDEERESRDCNYKAGLPDSNCSFVPNMDALPEHSASLMFNTNSPKVSEWCDNDVGIPERLHNKEANNEQNQKCGHKSVWEVLRQHSDFNDTLNPPSSSSFPGPPSFTLVKARPHCSTVLVLDVSGSMTINNRIDRLHQVASSYVVSRARDGDKVGIVTFHGWASVSANLTDISNSTRHELQQQVPSTAGGGTSIGDGLVKGLEVLRGEEDSYEGGGTILLLSDGEETTAPYVMEVLPQIANASVRVYAIALGTRASATLETITTETGGQMFSLADTEFVNTLNDAFQTMASDCLSTDEQDQQLISQVVVLPAGQSDVIDFLVDSTANSDLTVAIGYTAATAPDVSLFTPGEHQITATSSEYRIEPSFQTIYISLGDAAETGQYRLHLTNPATEQQTLYTTVTSKPSQGEEFPIVISAQWRYRTVTFPDMRQALYVSVSKGFAPVLYAQVKASLENPPVTSSGRSTFSDLQLLDNGAGADIQRNDGIYSSYVVAFTADGRYNTQVQVRDANDTVIGNGIVGVGVPPSARQRSDATSGRMPVPAEPFQRFSSAGSFTLDSYDASLGDVFGPSQVQDLEVRSLTMSSVQLQWTAPGDDLDHGTAAGYVLKMAEEFDVLLNNHSQTLNVSDDDILGGTLLNPLHSGETEIITVRLNNETAATYYFSIQAYDNSSNISPPSNIVSVTTALPEQGSSTSPPSNISNVTTAFPVQELKSESHLVVVVVVVTVVAVLLIAVVVVAVMYRRRSTRRKFAVSSIHSKWQRSLREDP